MLRKANRRIAVGVGLVALVASLAISIPSAYAATITQTAPLTGSVSAGTAFGPVQLNTSSTPGSVTFVTTTISPAFTVSSSGAVTAPNTLTPATYTVSGTDSDTSANTGFWSFALTVNPAGGTITQQPPTTGSVSAGTAFNGQLNTSGNNGAVTFVTTTPSPPFTVSSTGAVTAPNTLTPATYTVSGTDSDAFGNSGSWSFVLTVTPAGGTLNQTAPTTGSVTSPTSSTFTDQLHVSGSNGAITFAKKGGSGNLVVSSSGAVTTTGILAGGTYTATGTVSDTFGDTGNFSYTLTVNAVLPGAPAITSATSGNNSVNLHWTPPATDGGSGISGYVVTPSPGSPILVGSATHFNVTGLSNGVAYTFTVAAINAAGVGPASALSASVTPAALGYWLVASDGGIFAFGPESFFGSTGSLHLNQPIVGMAATPFGNGYWLVASDGGIFTFGDAAFFGSTGALKLNSPIVGMASTPSGKGYWLVASDGGIFAFGDAKFHGSMGGKPLNKPIVAMASTSGGNGYWLVASDGGVFAFGSAGFFGSTGAIHLNKPIVGMAPSTHGYWMVASDGGIFAFGDAAFYGSTGGVHLNKPIVGLQLTPHSKGYWLVASDGGIFAFGDAIFYGSTGATPLNQPIVGVGG